MMTVGQLMWVSKQVSHSTWQDFNNFCYTIIIIFCCTAGFWHLFSVSPSLSVLSCPFECNKATIICQIMQHLNSSPPSCWFTSHSAFNNFMQKSVMQYPSPDIKLPKYLNILYPEETWHQKNIIVPASPTNQLSFRQNYLSKPSF